MRRPDDIVRPGDRFTVEIAAVNDGTAAAEGLEIGLPRQQGLRHVGDKAQQRPLSYGLHIGTLRPGSKVSRRLVLEVCSPLASPAHFIFQAVATWRDSASGTLLSSVSGMVDIWAVPRLPRG